MKIIEYTERFKNQLVGFILEIQNNEYHLKLSIEDQLDLLDIENEYKKFGNFWIAVDDDNNIQGCIATKLLKNNRAALKKMFVSKKSRRLGIGTALMDKCLEFLKFNNIDELFLGTIDIFKQAKFFYESKGFIEVDVSELPKDFPILEVDNVYYKLYLSSTYPQFNPYLPRIVDKIYISSKNEREKILVENKNNIFKIPTNRITFDLFTDSGISSLDIKQYIATLSGVGGPMGRGKNYDDLSKILRDTFGMKYSLLCLQGRSAEALFNKAISSSEKKIVLCNNLFSTTKYHQELNNLTSINISDSESENLHSNLVFKGNVDISLLRKNIVNHKEKIAYVCIELCSNSIGGYPISLKNLKEVRGICADEKIPVVLDATRILENAYFIRKYEKSQPIGSIVKEICELSDYVTASLKKDFLCDSGGFIGCNKKEMYLKMADLSIIYGQELSNFDKAVITEGITEAINNEENLNYRMFLTKGLHSYLKEKQVNILEPVSGHGVWIDVTDIVNKYGISLYSIQLSIFLETGVRVGSQVFNKNSMLRLAIPHRKYDESHMRYIAKSISDFFNNKLYLLKRYKKCQVGESITETLYAEYSNKVAEKINE